jgi:signal transduction histidine kinase
VEFRSILLRNNSNAILDLSKIEAGKMGLYLETFDVSRLLEEVRCTVQPAASHNANTLDVSVAANVGLMHADLTKVRQSLLNLLSNACKFTTQGRITLRVTRETGEGREWYVFYVHDTGIGMTTEQVGQLFQDFVQVDASTTRQYGGTGLGLAISQRFCRMMGGNISATSTVGQGSTFTIRLPMEVRERGSTHGSAGEAARLHSGHTARSGPHPGCGRQPHSLH